MPYSPTQMTTFFTNVHAGRAPTAAEQLLLNAWAQQTSGGALSDAAALQLVVDSADAESAVALLTYQYFTGSVPTAAGLAFLVNSATNATDLNDAYYAAFNIENRYVNFAANLALSGPTAASFATTYGAFTIAQTIAVAYETIIGSAQAGTAGINVAAAQADIGGAARIAYFNTVVNQAFPTATAAQKDLALKAEIIGYIMAEAVKANVGAYSNAASRLLADLALDNVATLGADMTASYSTAPGGTTGVSVFALTTGADSIVGTSGDDTINAGAGTYTVGDSINGGAGIDSLNLTLNGAAPAATIAGVEKVFVTASPNSATLDLAGVSGVTEIWNKSSANGATVTVSNVGAIATSGIDSTTTALTVNYTTAAVVGTADAGTLVLSGASNSSFTTSGIESLTVNSTGSANTLSALTDTGITRLNVTGSANLTVTGAVGGATIATVDASAATGAVTLVTGAGAGGTAAVGVTVLAPTAAAAGAFNVTTSTNRDTVTLGAGNATVDTGANNDTINAGVGTNLITSGTGNDTITLTGTKDTLRFAESGAANSDIVNAFSATSVISLNLGTAATASAAAAANAQFATVATGATSPTMSGVGGAAAATTFTAGTTFNEISTGGAIAAGSTIVELTGVFTDGTAAGVITALGASATTGITTVATSKFVLVTYSVGNIAQVWSYAGDATVNTDIDAAELSLVATLNGVSAGSLGPANFSTYLGAAAAAVAGPLTGQTINLGGLLNTVTTTSNAAGQFFTGAADTVNVQVGTLPIAAATATTGLVLVDSTVGDGDVVNATVLGDWAAGSLFSGVETINLNMLVPGTTFSAAARTPGATTFGLTGTGAFAVTDLSNSSTLSLGAGYTGAVTGALLSTAGAADVVNVTLAGSVATATATGAIVTLAAGGIETANINVTAASSLRVAGSGILSAGAPGAGTVAATNLTGTAALTLFGAAADLATAQLTTSALYTGALTVRPSTNAAMDFAAVAGGQVTGIRTIDLSDTPTFNSTITLAATNGAFAPTVSFAPVTAGTSVAAIDVFQSGTNLTDALAVSLSANSAGVTGAITALGTETLTISGARAGTVAITNVVLTDGLGTQAVTVTGGATTNFTLGTVTADTVNTAGVTGTVSLTLANTAGVVFTGGAGATTVVGTAAADIITTGIGADFITGGVGNDIMTGGAGVDTFIFNGAAGQTNNVAAGSFDQINDFTVGIDKLQFTTVVDVVSGQQAAVQTAVTALAAGATALQIANAMAGANTTNLGVSFATFGGDTYVLYETTGATATFTVADDIFIKLVGVTTIPTFAVDVIA